MPIEMVIPWVSMDTIASRPAGAGPTDANHAVTNDGQIPAKPIPTAALVAPR